MANNDNNFIPKGFPVVVVVDDDDDDDDDDDLLFAFGEAMDKQVPDNQEVEVIVQEDERLSQQMSQLSTSTDNQKQTNDIIQTSENKRSPPATPVSATLKKMKVDHDVEQETSDDDDDIEEEDGIVADYLVLTNGNFQQIVNSIISASVNVFTIEDIQEIALYLRRILIIQCKKSLWTIYLQSGTGKLRIDDYISTDSMECPCLWSTEVKSKLLLKLDKEQKQHTPIRSDLFDHTTCLNYVNEKLYYYSNQLVEYERKLQNKKFLLNDWFTLHMEEIIIEFIEQNELKRLQQENRRKIAMIKYDYSDQIIDREYNRLKPTSSQLNLWKNIIELKEEKLKSENEVELWKRRRSHRHFPDSLKVLQLPLQTTLSFNSITDDKNRQRLISRLRRITEEMKLEMMTFYISIAETRMSECSMKFNENLSQLRSNRELNAQMMKLLEQRFKIMDQRFEFVYKLNLSIMYQ